MDKLRNFIYDKSDLLVAIGIILIAAVIIFFSVNSIMDPIGNSNEALATEEVADLDDVATNGAISGAGISGAAVTTGTATTPQGANGTTGAATATNTAIPNSNGQAVSIIIKTGDTSEQIADKLVASKVIKSRDGFLKKLKKSGKETKLKAGRYQIPQNATYAQIIKILTD